MEKSVDDHLFMRPIEPADRDIIARGYHVISEGSRYGRFFTHKENLSESDLDYLTKVDNKSHVGLLAFLPCGAPVQSVEDRHGNILVGVGRYVGLGDGVAEVALVSSDRYRNRGVARRLLDELRRIAVDNGYSELIGFTLSENVAMRAVLRKFAAKTSTPEVGVIRFSIAL